MVIRAVHGNGTVFPVIGQRRAAHKAIVAFGAGEAVLLHKEPRIFTQDRILSYLLGRQDEPTIQKDIEDFFEIRHPTVIGILQRMESKGFIVSSVDPADKRQRLIRATQSASDLAEKIEKHREEIEDRMAEGMSKDELEELKVLLYKIYKNISHE